MSIEIHTKKIMEIFRLEPLEVKNYNIQFQSDYRKTRHSQTRFTNISFLNIPAETTDEPLTEVLEQYTVSEGSPHYPTKSYNDIFHRNSYVSSVKNIRGHTTVHSEYVWKNNQMHLLGTTR